MQVQKINNQKCNTPAFGINLTIGERFSDAVNKKGKLKEPMKKVLMRLAREFAYSDSHANINYISYGTRYDKHGRLICDALTVYNDGIKKPIKKLTPDCVYNTVASFIKDTDDYKGLKDYLKFLKGTYGVFVNIANYFVDDILKIPPSKIKEFLSIVATTLSEKGLQDEFLFNIVANDCEKNGFAGKLIDKKLGTRYDIKKEKIDRIERKQQRKDLKDNELTTIRDLIEFEIEPLLNSLDYIIKKMNFHTIPQEIALDSSSTHFQKLLNKSIDYLTKKRLEYEKIEKKKALQAIKEEHIEMESGRFFNGLRADIIHEQKKARKAVNAIAPQLSIPPSDVANLVAKALEDESLKYEDLLRMAKECHIPSLEEEMAKLQAPKI